MINFRDPPRRSLTRDDPSAFAAPAQFGTFRVLHQIGVGALGPVFRTYEPERDRLVAVKVFRLDITPEQARALADGLSRLAEAGLFHPSIVEPIGAGVEGTIAYAADEYVAAESLDVAMRDYAPAPVDVALPLITQLAGAIDFARVAGVGHGALHPRDVFVTPEEARATGFGVAEALERIGLRAPVRRPYSAPERIAGTAWSTPADVFSLAALAYELLTGRRPAGLGPEIGPLTAATPNGRTDALHAVLARAMDEDPGTRYPTALALASALEAAAHGELPPAAVSAVAVPELATDAPLELAGDPDAGHPAGQGQPEEELALREQDADDIAHERDDDEAHQRLILEELPEPQRTGEIPRDLEWPDDIEVESDADRFLVDVAGTAAGAAFADDFLEPEAATATREGVPAGEEGAFRVTPSEVFEPGGGRPGESAFEPEFEPDHRMPAGAGVAAGDEWFRQDDPRQDDEPVVDAPAERYRPNRAASGANSRGDFGARDFAAGYTDVPPERHGTWKSAVLLIVGLLGGLAAGYTFWGGGAPAGDGGTGLAPGTGVSVGAGDTAQPETGQPDAAAPPAVTTRTPATLSTPEPPPGSTPAGAASTGRAEAAPVPAPPGILRVRSTPSGAGVLIDGTWRGRTPLTVDELPLARYQVRVVESGYVAANESVTLSPGRPDQTLTLQLQQEAPPAARGTPPASRGGGPAPRGTTAPGGGKPAARGTQAPATPPAAAFTGSIYVDSRPRGAAVTINGKPVGVTPLRIPEMRIGTHVVRLELPDHRIWSSTARVTAGQEVRVTGSLEPIQ